VSSIYHVELSRSEQFSVKVEAPDFVMPYLDVKTENGKLKLGMKEMPQNIRLKLETKGRKEVRAFVSMPTLAGLNMSGASKLASRGEVFPAGREFDLKMSGATHLEGLSVEAGEADIKCSGAAKFKLKGSFDNMDLELSGAVSGSLDTGSKALREMKVKLSGASNLEWSGSAGELSLTGSGAAKIDASGAPADKADVRLSGASMATVNVEKELSVNLSGASACHYKSGAQFRITKQSISRGATIKQL